MIENVMQYVFEKVFPFSLSFHLLVMSFIFYVVFYLFKKSKVQFLNIIILIFYFNKTNIFRVKNYLKEIFS